jgi:phage shock protein A
MSGNEQNLLVVFEDCVHDITKLCSDRKRQIEELEASLKDKDEKIQQVEQMITALKTKYTNLLTARRLADDTEAFQQARKRVNKLVREVDLCIALLNE